MEQNESSDYTDSVAQATQDEPGLVFTGEMLNGRPVIKGGNIEKLVERLTYEKYNGKLQKLKKQHKNKKKFIFYLKTIDSKYMKAFMLTFRSFTTPMELLKLLIARYNLPPPPGTDIATFEQQVLKVVRLR